MKPKHIAEMYGSVLEATENAIVVARDFLKLVSVWGVDVHGAKAPSDKRYRVYVNGSYFELAGYCFTYDYMHGTDEVYWTFLDFDRTIIYKGARTSRGQLYIDYLIKEGMHVKHLIDSGVIFRPF